MTSLVTVGGTFGCWDLNPEWIAARSGPTITRKTCHGRRFRIWFKVHRASSNVSGRDLIDTLFRFRLTNRKPQVK